MLQPEGFVDPDRPNHVCKLKKSTYELINSPLTVGTLLWMSIGYCKSKAEGSTYVKFVKEANCRISSIILGVYVEDVIPASNEPALLKTEKAALCERFEMIDQEDIHYLLGTSIKRYRDSRT